MTDFEGRVEYFPHLDHSPPPLQYLDDYCVTVDTWLNADPANVIAVHCKAGKGRTGVFICAYMIQGMGRTVQQALVEYGAARTDNNKGVTIPSQQRFLQYFELRCSGAPSTTSAGYTAHRALTVLMLHRALTVLMLHRALTVLMLHGALTILMLHRAVSACSGVPSATSAGSGNLFNGSQSSQSFLAIALSDYSPCALTVLSPCSHHALIVCSHRVLIVCSHRALTVCSRCTLTVLSSCSHRVLSPC